MKFSVSVISVTFADASDYIAYPGKTAYTGHGGTEIDSESTAPSGLSVDSCEARCNVDASCECVSFRPADGKCWKRGACQPSQFGSDSSFNTYVKSGGPSPPPAPTPAPTPGSSDCLCIFDIDRTLTGKQERTDVCPANSIQAGVRDNAYGGGTLTLSQLAQAVQSTFCSKCYLGIISAGDAAGGGSAERRVLHDRLKAGDSTGALPDAWSAPGCGVTSPMVTSCADGQKQTAVPGIMRWYRDNAGAMIEDRNVHMFDDRVSNIVPFRGLAYNARQISCRSRDGEVGLCGAELSEIVETPGVALCGSEDREMFAAVV